MRKVLASGFALALLAAFVLTGSAAKPSKPGAALEVSMTASGHWTQSYDWTISKTVQTDQLVLTGGDPAVADYTITLGKSAPLDSYSVDGEVCVTNPGDRDTGELTITSDVVYQVDGKGRSRTLASTTVNVSAMPTLPAGASYCYPYTVDFVPVTAGTYAAEAVVVAASDTGKKNGSSSPKADFAVPESADRLTNDSVVVDDDSDTFTFTDDGSVSYQRSYATAGTFTNTATIRQTGQFATATVTVSPVTCSTVWDAVAYWCFDDEVSPTADGASIHDGVIQGPVFSSDIPNVTGNVASVAFDGLDDYVFVADPGTPNDLDGFAGLTMSAWVKPSSAAGDQMIVTKYDTGAANSISYWFILRSDEVEIFVATQRPTYEDRLTTSGVNLVPGAWVHLTGTWDGAYLRIYVNGQLVAEKATSIAVMDNSNVPLNIGAAEYVTSYGQRWFFFDGLIDEMYLFDRALSVTEIGDLASGAVK